MDNFDYISQDEASNISGVSPVTLNRFADAGYLQVEKGAGGEFLFSKKEVKRVFGIASHEEEVTPTIVKDIELKNSSAPLNAGTITPPSSIAESTPSSPEQVGALDAPSIQTVPVEHERKLQERILILEKEVSRLTSVSDLQEKYIEHKEAELRSIKEDRDWLRGRIEKLEEKNDRDQLILVSVSETNRGLIRAIENRRSSLRSALEWIGLLPPPSDETVSGNSPKTSHQQ